MSNTSTAAITDAVVAAITDAVVAVVAATTDAVVAAVAGSSSTFDPFLDLSVPIHRDDENESRKTSFLGSLRGSVSSHGDNNKSTLDKCLAKFTGAFVARSDSVSLFISCD